MDLYSADESGAAWPKYGQIDYSALTGPGKHYTAAAPEWNDKPYGFADFLRSARFDNSVANGKVLSQESSSSQRLQLRHLQGPPLAEIRHRHVRHA